MVVKAGVPRLPPCVEPGFRVLVAPEELERAFAAAFESGEVDELGRRAGEGGTLLGSENMIRSRQRFVAVSIDHDLILHRLRASWRMKR